MTIAAIKYWSQFLKPSNYGEPLKNNNMHDGKRGFRQLGTRKQTWHSLLEMTTLGVVGPK